MKRRLVSSLGAVVLVLGLLPTGVLAAGLTGAVFTTDSPCAGTNVNIFASKDEVYLDGGPAHEGAAGLPNGAYYGQVTEPDGTVLGQTVTASIEVSGGSFLHCYQLTAIMFTASSLFLTHGYDDTSNAGGEYKVWVSQDPAFANAVSKTDNFKVKDDGTGTTPEATLHVIKFYDANANGINDDVQPITGW